MGSFFSSFATPEVPPNVVLVPPLLDRERKGRSRFAKSSYDRLFAKPQLNILFGDYLAQDVRGLLHFTPPEDERISVLAKLGVPQRGGESTAGSMTLRYQPLPGQPYTFFDIKAKTEGTASNAALRACIFDPTSRMAFFGLLPLVATAPKGPAAAAVTGSEVSVPQLGLRYTSPTLSCGLITGVRPTHTLLHSTWVVGRVGGLLLGAQCAPGLPFGSLFSSLTNDTERAVVANRCQDSLSYAVAYQPEGQSAYGRGVFTAAVEMAAQQLSISFLHHMAVQRNVQNPFEHRDVVGITNYLDVGFQMVTDLSGAREADMRLGASWQVNKNVKVKARVGLDGVAAALVLRSWWQPSFTLGAAGIYDLRSRTPKWGVTLAIENWNALRYERSPAGQRYSGARITQRHVASEEDVAYHEGRGMLVPLDEVDNPKVLGQEEAQGAAYL
ncbi:hypothetical protein N2152v2_003161 [Parachlorella kessleri]